MTAGPFARLRKRISDSWLTLHEKMNEEILVSQGAESLFGSQKVLIVHMEFSGFCNKQCSYCIEGNDGSLKTEIPYSSEDNYVRAVDKIYEIVNDDDFVGFIIAGGEAALQPALKAVVERIRQRKNSCVLLTTNLTKSEQFFTQLNVPLIASLHLENTKPDRYFEKVMNLRHLVAHLRIMAHPDMMDMVKDVYAKFSKTPIDFAVERIFPVDTFTKTYTPQGEELLETLRPVSGEYPEALLTMMGPLSGLFYKFNWNYKRFGGMVKRPHGESGFKGFFCERNVLVIHNDGQLLQSWCNDPGINIFQAESLPKDIFSTVICPHAACSMGVTSSMPRFRTMEYAPAYLKKHNN